MHYNSSNFNTSAPCKTHTNVRIYKLLPYYYHSDVPSTDAWFRIYSWKLYGVPYILPKKRVMNNDAHWPVTLTVSLTRCLFTAPRGSQRNGKGHWLGALIQGSNSECGTLFWIYSRIFRRYALSGRRRARRHRGACGDFVNFKICWLSPSKVLIGVGFAYVFIGVSVRACWVSALYCVI